MHVTLLLLRLRQGSCAVARVAELQQFARHHSASVTDHCVVTLPLLVTSAPCSVFKRLDEKVAAAAMGSDARAALRRFARRLRSVSEEMRAHAATLAAFEGTPGEEWEALAAKRRRDLTAEFFEYLQTLAAAAGDNTARREGAQRLIIMSRDHTAGHEHLQWQVSAASKNMAA